MLLETAFILLNFGLPCLILMSLSLPQELATDREHFRPNLMCLNPYSSLCYKRIKQTSLALDTTYCYSPKPRSQVSNTQHCGGSVDSGLSRLKSVFWIN